MTMPVTVTEQGSVAVVRIDDGKVNALSLDVISQLGAALDGVRDADAVVLTGRDGCLSAGLDRSVMLGADRAAVTANLRTVTGLYETLLSLPAPTLVGCSGHALAAGALFLLVADVRIGAAGPWKIGLNEVQIGLPLFPLAIAVARARLASTAFVAATLEATVYDAAGAAEVGYLDRVVEPTELLDVAVDHATRLGRLDRRAYLTTRRLILAPVLDEVVRATAGRAGQAPTPG